MRSKDPDTHRLVSWNTARWSDADAVRLRELGCDVAVLCEAGPKPPAPSVESADQQVSWHWKGRQSKGLVLAGFGQQVDAVDDRVDAGRYSMAATTTLGFGVLGIWSCPEKGSREPYGLQVHRAVHAHADWLADSPAIVAGDFNVSPNGNEDSRTGVLRQLWADLEGLGYVSLYHHRTGEPYGAETAPTYFHLWRQDRGFHIDFCFVHRDLLPRVTGFQVGTYRDYVRGDDGRPRFSDHVPLVVDLVRR